MLIARWQFTSRFGKLDDCISILRKWETDVGERVGWKTGGTRIFTGFLGGPETEVEFEAHFDNLADYESALGDMDRNPHHREYLKLLEANMVAGTSRRSILRKVDLIAGGP